MVEMAFGMIEVIQAVNREQNIGINMRIGLHTGEVIAGITGTNIVRYDIYGADVTLANKMESGGEPGRVNVSEVTRTLVDEKAPGRFKYEDNSVQTVKGVDKSAMSYLIDYNN
jgi:class 3 adenylate cyclase